MIHRMRKPLDNAKVQLTGGLLHDRVHGNIETRLSSKGYRALLEPFLVNQHFTFYGEYGAKYLCAYAMAYRYSKNPQILENMTEMKDTILQNQKPDGYLGTESVEEDHWKDWNVWNYKYVLLGLLHYMEATDDDSVLPALEKGALLCAKTFLAPDGPDVLATPWEGYTGASILEPFALLYRRTGRREYLEFCQYILRRLEEKHHLFTKLLSGARACDIEPRKAYEITTTMEGVLEVYRITGEASLFEAVKRYWESVRDTQISITGSGSQFELWQFDPDVVYQDGSQQHAMENCVTNYWIRLSRQLYWQTGEAKYAQAMNRSVFNSLFAEQKPDGSDACYYQALSGTKRFGVDCPYPFHWAHCCHSSSTRTLSELPSFCFAQNGAQIDAVLFGGMHAAFTVEDARVEIEETTAYPADGEIHFRFSLEQPRELAFRILIPDWATGASVSFGGECRGANPGEFALISRRFEDGDEVTVSLHMISRVIFGAGESAGRAALQVGPMILAVDERFGVPPDRVTLLLSRTGEAVLRPEPLPEQDPVTLCFSTEALIDGKPDRVPLVDFVHAGSYGETSFGVWLDYQTDKGVVSR